MGIGREGQKGKEKTGSGGFFTSFNSFASLKMKGQEEKGRRKRNERGKETIG
jgi:hypothetical protein